MQNGDTQADLLRIPWENLEEVNNNDDLEHLYAQVRKQLEEDPIIPQNLRLDWSQYPDSEASWNDEWGFVLTGTQHEAAQPLPLEIKVWIPFAEFPSRIC